MARWGMFRDYFRFASRSIMKRRLRSWLTMIGIFIGIAAVVALISLGEGLQGAIQQEFEDMGAGIIFVSPAGAIFGAGGVNALTEDDINVIRKVRGVDIASGYLFSTGQVEWGDETRFNVVQGLYPTDEMFELFSNFNTKVEEGRRFRTGEKNKAIIGWDYKNSPVFKDHLDLGDKFTINGEKFEVVGIWARIGNPSDDRSVSIPIDTARELLNVPERLDGLMAQVKSNEDPKVVADRIEETMRRDRNEDVGNEDFAVQTFQNYLETFLVILDIVTSVLVGIALISLFVGCIGIMNTMYTAVLERTQEIGVMKAIGARNSDILTLFLIESGLLGMAGGLIGILLGAGISSLTAYLAQNLGGFEYLQAHFPLWLVVGALVFSFVVGVLAGVLPAMQAAKKSPVDSLRYE